MAHNPAIQEQNARSAILFIQQQHADTLKGLHSELSKLQKKCSDLTFELAMQTTTISQEEHYRAETEKLRVQMEREKQTNASQSQQLATREKDVSTLEDRLRAQERLHAAELRTLRHAEAEIRAELDSKAEHTAQLMTQLLTLKKASVCQYSGAQLSFNPSPPREPAPRHRRRMSGKYSSLELQHRPSSSLYERPNTSPVPDPAPFLQRAEQKTMVKPIGHDKAVLPPIACDGGDSSSSGYTLVRKTLQVQSSPTCLETLALGQATAKHEPGQWQPTHDAD